MSTFADLVREVKQLRRCVRQLEVNPEVDSEAIIPEPSANEDEDDERRATRYTGGGFAAPTEKD